MEQSTVDEIFTMLEPWLRLEQDLARELSVNILLRALETYLKGVKLGVNSPSNFTPGPYMIGAMVPRCHDPSRAVRTGALACVQALLRTLALYEGLAQETVEQTLVQLDSVNTRCNGEDREDLTCLGQVSAAHLSDRAGDDLADTGTGGCVGGQDAAPPPALSARQVGVTCPLLS